MDDQMQQKKTNLYERNPSYSSQPSDEDAPVNVSGHKQELRRNFGFANICGLGLTSGNTWIALGGSITTAIYDGGPPGVIYEFIAASVFYWFIAASLAELASSIPSSGGVYHWAAVTGGRYGRPCGWFAGWWNFFAWIFGAASTAQIVATQAVSAYALMHPGFEISRWQVFVTYLIVSIGCCCTVAFVNRALPRIELLTGTLVVLGFFVTVIVCAAMPHVNGQPYASNDFVWRDWKNTTGWSNGFTFCLGMLNGAFAVGTPDVITHVAEEVPKAGRNIPLAMLAQYVIGFITAFTYCIAIFYGINDLDDVLNAPYLFPLTEVYRQITGTRGGALGLTIVTLLPMIGATIGCYITSSRLFWALARDRAVPLSRVFKRVNKSQRNPMYAALMCGVVTTVLGCIYMGSETAFEAFISSFAVLTTVSYAAAILPNILTGRKTPRGYFFMKGPVGFIVNSVACAYIIVFIVIFCFPTQMPVNAESMNYTCLITGGLSVFILIWWFIRQGSYTGPSYTPHEEQLKMELEGA